MAFPTDSNRSRLELIGKLQQSPAAKMFESDVSDQTKCEKPPIGIKREFVSQETKTRTCSLKK